MDDEGTSSTWLFVGTSDSAAEFRGPKRWGPRNIALIVRRNDCSTRPARIGLQRDVQRWASTGQGCRIVWKVASVLPLQWRLPSGRFPASLGRKKTRRSGGCRSRRGVKCPPRVRISGPQIGHAVSRRRRSRRQQVPRSVDEDAPAAGDPACVQSVPPPWTPALLAAPNMDVAWGEAAENTLYPMVFTLAMLDEKMSFAWLSGIEDGNAR